MAASDVWARQGSLLGATCLFGPTSKCRKWRHLQPHSAARLAKRASQYSISDFKPNRCECASLRLERCGLPYLSWLYVRRAISSMTRRLWRTDTGSASSTHPSAKGQSHSEFAVSFCLRLLAKLTAVSSLSMASSDTHGRRGRLKLRGREMLGP